MRSWAKVSIGVGLIFVAILGAGYGSRYLSPAMVEVVTPSIRMPNGRQAFAVVFNDWAWWGLTGQKTPANEPLTDHAEGEVRNVINRALEVSGQHCPDRWLLSAVNVLPDLHEVWVAGYCATAAELARD